MKNYRILEKDPRCFIPQRKVLWFWVNMYMGPRFSFGRDNRWGFETVGDAQDELYSLVGFTAPTIVLQ